MNKQAQVAKAQKFHGLHDRARPLLLPNAWDAASTALFALDRAVARLLQDGDFDQLASDFGYADAQDLFNRA